MNTKQPFLSVIVPAYNEEHNVGKDKMSKMFEYLESRDYEYEVIFVDDGSNDKTAELLEDMTKKHNNVRVISKSHQGKANTVMAGMLAARGENRLFTDFDQSTPITEIEKMLPFRAMEYDVVIGSREVKGAKRDEEPWYRHLMGKVFNMTVKIFTIRGIQDTQCGFKMMSAKAAEELFSRLRVTNKKTKYAFTGAFDVELLFIAQKMGYRIAEVPVHWHHEDTERVNPIRDSIQMFFQVLNIRLYDLFKGYR